MNQIIKQQLLNCKVADISGLDTKTGKCIIPRFKQVKLEEDSCYLVKLADKLLIPNVDDTYHINWNRGIVPTSKYLLIDVSRVVGKNVKVNGVGYDIDSDSPTTYVWDGWLPLEQIEIIKEM